MLVSIIVPIYNSEKYLKRCLESIVNQTYKDLELILVNDGSTDSSLNICHEYANKDKRIIVINKENEGVSIARNCGLDKASGEKICFIDSDDYIESNMIEKMIKVFDNNNEIDMVISGYLKCNKKIRKISVTEEEKRIEKEDITQFVVDSCFKSFINSPFAKLISRKIIKENNLYFEEGVSMGEDLIFNLEVLKHIKGLILIPDFLYYYMSDNNMSLTNKPRNELFEEEMHMYQAVKKFVSESDKCKEYSARAEGYMIMVIRVYLSYIFLHNKSAALRKKYINQLIENNEVIKALMESDMYGNINKFVRYIVINKRTYLIYIFFDIKNRTLKFRR